MNSDIRIFIAETDDVTKMWNGESGEWEIQIGNYYYFLRLIVYNAEKTFFSGDYRYPTFF